MYWTAGDQPGSERLISKLEPTGRRTLVRPGTARTARAEGRTSSLAGRTLDHRDGIPDQDVDRVCQARLLRYVAGEGGRVVVEFQGRQAASTASTGSSIPHSVRPVTPGASR